MHEWLSTESPSSYIVSTFPKLRTQSGIKVIYRQIYRRGRQYDHSGASFWLIAQMETHGRRKRCKRNVSDRREIRSNSAGFTSFCFYCAVMLEGFLFKSSPSSCKNLTTYLVDFSQHRRISLYGLFCPECGPLSTSFWVRADLQSPMQLCTMSVRTTLYTCHSHNNLPFLSSRLAARYQGRHLMTFQRSFIGQNRICM